MAMVFSIDEQDCTVTHETPPELTRYLLPGSKLSAVNRKNLKVMVQEFGSTCHRVFHSVHVGENKSTLQLRDDGPFFMIYLALQHDRRMEIEGLGTLLLKEGQYNFLYAPRFDMLLPQEENKTYMTLSIQYDMNILLEWASYFPTLADFLAKAQDGVPATLLSQAEWCTKDIQDTVYKMLHADWQHSCSQVYFDLLVKTLLFHLLHQSAQQRPASNYSHNDVEGIQAAGEMIRKNLRYHFAIREIAQKVGMNEFKLKNGFRELYGNGVYEYLRTERMQHARSLLSERGHSIKEIAALTGYHSVNSFIKAFKKKYGETPGAFKKHAV